MKNGKQYRMKFTITEHIELLKWRLRYYWKQLKDMI